MTPHPNPQAEVTLLSTEVGFCEGPVFARDGAVFAVAIDRGEVTRTDPTGRTTLLARTGGGPNGLVADGHGGFYLCQNGGIWPAVEKGEAGLQYIDREGEVSQVATGLTAPNDLAFGPDGLLYITDPTRNAARDDGRIWRFDPDTGACQLWRRLGFYCNGIGFGLEDDRVYVADTGGGRIVTLPLNDAPEAPLTTVARLRHGLPDGFAFDVEGRLLIGSIGGAEGEAGCLELHDPATGEASRIDCGASRFLTNVALSPDGLAVLTDSGNGRLLTWRHGVPGLPLHPFR